MVKVDPVRQAEHLVRLKVGHRPRQIWQLLQGSWDEKAGDMRHKGSGVDERSNGLLGEPQKINEGEGVPSRERKQTSVV